MNTFEASNGARFSEKENGTLVFSGGILDYPFELSPGVVYGLRAFFQHERDEELGRWRWPDNPDYVVYARDTGDWLVLNESNGHTKHYTHRHHASVGGSNMTKAARAFFDAHPERKPWHDAKTGEVWVITVEGEESAWTVNNAGRFENPDSTYELTNRNITDARRIWPGSD